MKTIVIYDTQFGNTEEVARAVAGELKGEVKIQNVKDANPADLSDYDLLVIGSPTQGGRQKLNMKSFLDVVKDGALKGKSVAAFDTRMKSFWVKMFGWAADRIAGALTEKGAELIASAEGFFVKSAKGPLAEGELERAKTWGKSLAEKAFNADAPHKL
jgi:flavodoxin I